MKRCTGCGTDKPIDAFHRDHAKPDGHSPRCKACKAIAHKRYHDAHKVEDALRAKKWRENNRAKKNAAALKWAKEHQERRKAITKASAARRYRKDIEQSRRQGREYARQWRQKNPEAARRLSARQLAKRDPDVERARHRSKTQRRRAQARATEIGPVDYQRIRTRDRMICHICKRKVKESDLEFDHVIPLARGGPHTEENLAVSHARCNRRKNATVSTLF